MLGLGGCVGGGASHRDVKTFRSGIAGLPFGHRVADEALNIGGEFLESGRGCAAAARTSGDERHESTQAQGLQQFLCDPDLKRAIAVWLGGQRYADRVPDSL